MKLYHISVEELARATGLAYSSLRRWRERLARGAPVIRKPGQKKIEPLDLERFGQELDKLVHGRKRSYGTGELHRAFDQSLSRREIDEAVRNARTQSHVLKTAQTRHLEWIKPNTTWAMDDTCFAGRSGWIHTIRDLASRYQFEPITGAFATGEQVAAHLEKLFRRHGAPLFLKRDNGKNLNSKAVNDILAKWMVIPLNSPIHSPQYNGAIENAQKDWDRLMDPSDPYITSHLKTCSGLAAHDLNHTPRQVLRGQIPCTLFHGPDKLKVNKRYREKAYEWIKYKSLELIHQEDKHPACAWRSASLTWLQINHHINLTHPKSVTQFFDQICS